MSGELKGAATAPQPKAAFNRAQERASSSAKSQRMVERTHRPAPDIATKAERDARIAARPKPVPSLSLSPPGTAAGRLKAAQAIANEARIKSLEDRLLGAKAGFEKSFKQGQLRGRALGAFERSR